MRGLKMLEKEGWAIGVSEKPASMEELVKEFDKQIDEKIEHCREMRDESLHDKKTYDGMLFAYTTAKVMIHQIAQIYWRE
jgi:hypothetical protein